MNKSLNGFYTKKLKQNHGGIVSVTLKVVIQIV